MKGLSIFEVFVLYKKWIFGMYIINLKKINLNLNKIHNHPKTVNREMSDFYLYLFVFGRHF